MSTSGTDLAVLQRSIQTPANRWTQRFAWPLLLALLGIAAMGIDIPLAQWIHAKQYPHDLKKLFDLAEVFGHGFGAAAILLIVWVLAPDRRWGLPRTLCAAYLAGLGGVLLKLFLSRQRPNKMEALANIDTTAFQSFGNWLPFFSSNSAWQSFPSGHSAMATGLALALAWMFPRGKWLFAVLAALVMLQRLVSGYHFLSDTLWGASIGWLLASTCLPGGWISAPFDRLEERMVSE